MTEISRILIWEGVGGFLKNSCSFILIMQEGMGIRFKTYKKKSFFYTNKLDDKFMSSNSSCLPVETSPEANPVPTETCIYLSEISDY